MKPCTRRLRRHLRITFVVLAFVLSVLILASCQTSHVTDEALQPNFLIIVTDDQRYETMDAMPHTVQRIFKEGVTFDHGYVTTSLCCPSRSSIFTGLYAHNHGVLRNNIPLKDRPTIFTALHDAGYFTGVVGKYLNSYPGKRDKPLPEFDYWVAFGDHQSLGNQYDFYYDFKLEVGDTWIPHSGYITYTLRDYALTFLDQSADQDKPFALLLALPAPHSPSDPAPGDENLFRDVELESPAFNEADISDKPEAIIDAPLLTPLQVQELEDLYVGMYQSLHATDLAINAILDRLEAMDELDNTVIFFISDNGLNLGEHRDSGKVSLYEPSIHVPFALRYPPLVSGGQVNDNLVANIDIAPTIFDLAHLESPFPVDGRSLVPLLNDEGDWREELLIEVWRRDLWDDFSIGLRTVDYAFFEHHSSGMVYYELYNMADDPYQLINRAEDPAYAEILADLSQKLESLFPENFDPQ